MRALSACLLLSGLVQASNVYLSPPELQHSRLSPQQASQVLAAHLGLDQFEELTKEAFQLNYFSRETDFLATGDKNALLLLVDDVHASDIIPPSYLPNFAFSEPSSSYLPNFLRSFNQRAKEVYSHIYVDPSLPSEGVSRTLDIFSAAKPADEAFLAEISLLTDYFDSPAAADGDRFGGLHLSSLPQLAASYGRESEQYRLATTVVRTTIQVALSDKSIRLALLTYTPATTPHKRAPQFPLEDSPSLVVQQAGPARRPAVCYSSESACLVATDACSGHGSCVNTASGDEECFACVCEKTISESGQTQVWVGDMCKRQDISGPFVLLTGTVIVLLLLMGGAVSLLYTIGGQELPSILSSGIPGAGRKD